MNARILVVGVAILSLAGCVKRTIPGTEIDDTHETRAILDVIKKYQTAVESKNADAILALTSPDFKDDAGTPNPDDDLDRNRLEATLKDRFAKIDNVRLNVEVRGIEVQEDDATAVYYYTLRYETPGLSDKQQSASDIKKMQFKKAGDENWQIVSGI